MNKLRRNPFLFTLLLVTLLNAVIIGGMVSAQEHPPHWTYEGEEGPDHWGELEPSFELCSVGHFQSPIDIVSAEGADLADIEFSYAPSAMNILNNGHTVQVNYDAGSSISIDGDEYQLLQFHFHTPSEHTIDGEASPLEVHFVHRDAAGNLAVVGVMLNEGEAENAAFADVFGNLPAEVGEPDAHGMEVNAADMLPAGHAYDTYSGSLTTPPCSQGVRWLVLTDPVELSAGQIEAFHALFENNARPVQPLNERELMVDTSM